MMMVMTNGIKQIEAKRRFKNEKITTDIISGQPGGKRPRQR